MSDDDFAAAYGRAEAIARLFAEERQRLDAKIADGFARLVPMPPTFRYTGVVGCECTTVKACWKHGGRA